MTRAISQGVKFPFRPRGQEASIAANWPVGRLAIGLRSYRFTVYRFTVLSLYRLENLARKKKQFFFEFGLLTTASHGGPYLVSIFKAIGP